MNKYQHLFSPIKIGTVEVPNRIALLPMGVFSSRMMNNDGSYTKDGADYYIERAKGGTGLIITGLVPVPKGAGLPSIVNDVKSYTENMKYLADGVHKYGSKVFVMLTAMSGRASIHPTDPAPSSMPNVWDPSKNNPEMSIEDIHQYIEWFAQGAKAAKDAGIDGVEIHAVHEGYLLDQFTIAAWNKRNDEYGGSLENRLRFPCEIVKAINKACGEASIPEAMLNKAFEVWYPTLEEEYQEFGRDYEESEKVAKMLEEAGYDMLDCDNGSYDAWYWPHPPVYMPKACNLEDVEKVKQWVNIPVICGGRFDNPELAEKEIAAGKIDMMGMGRPLLADPDLANKFKEGREDDIRPCISCHFGCLARIFQVDMKTMSSKDISCALNPRCGMENHYNITKADVIKKVAVVGGGNVAMDAARCAKRMGAEHVYIVYRRSEKEMPARLEEVHHAKEEGIEFHLLENPVQILNDGNGQVCGIECLKMELGEPDASGRRSPIPIEGSNYVLDVDTVVMSLGTSPNPLIRSTTKGLETNRKGCLVVNEETNQTTREGVYAGGDAVTGAATVILAMEAGKAGAKGIDEYLKGKEA